MSLFNRSEIIKLAGIKFKIVNEKEIKDLIEKKKVYLIKNLLPGRKFHYPRKLRLISLKDGKITGLICNEQGLEKIPINSDNLDKVKYLDLSFNKITSIPIGLNNLEFLDLSFNYLKEIPKGVGKLKKLKFLSFSHQIELMNSKRITEVPKEVGNLENLEILDLSYNDIAKIPKEICDLKKLKVLNLSNNKLKSLPDNILNLFPKNRKKLFEKDFLFILNLRANKELKSIKINEKTIELLANSSEMKRHPFKILTDPSQKDLRKLIGNVYIGLNE